MNPELVVQKNGEVRQAGAAPGPANYVSEFKEICEKDLYAFSKGVLGKYWFSTELHMWCCNWLQKIPSYRKLLMLPRGHCKTAIVSHCLPIHIIIQPKDSNIYIPGLPGSASRILLAGESETRSTDHLRVLKTEFEGNDLLRALWPEVMWDKPKRDAGKWNEKEMIVRRDTEYPDPSIRAVGVGGAITGARPNIIIKDDLISIEAANSDVVMQTAIEWHIASRALLDSFDTDSGAQSLEFIIGTHWAAYDLYTSIEQDDPTVDVIKRSIYEIDEDGETRIIWPERFTWDQIQELKKSFGARFWLLYMNEPTNQDIADFDMNMVRRFTMTSDGAVEFNIEQRDYTLEKLKDQAMNPEPPPDENRQNGKQVFTKYGSDTHDRLFTKRGGFFDSKYMAEWRKDTRERQN